LDASRTPRTVFPWGALGGNLPLESPQGRATSEGLANPITERASVDFPPFFHFFLPCCGLRARFPPLLAFPPGDLLRILRLFFPLCGSLPTVTLPCPGVVPVAGALLVTIFGRVCPASGVGICLTSYCSLRHSQALHRCAVSTFLSPLFETGVRLFMSGEPRTVGAVRACACGASRRIDLRLVTRRCALAGHFPYLMRLPFLI